ncbi:hypothetical protein ACOSP6_04535 [Tenacibaculum sp. MEBiC06402]|uniref:hypothetical protein n=1 Tax=unclassified Tenacibaculum TaxID=2635139 RepID=UPI003B9DAF44
MKKSIFVLLLTTFTFWNNYSQKMTPNKLGNILEIISDSIVSNKSQWRFIIRNTAFITIADSTHNRMRIMSPIIESEKLSEGLKTASLMANFHTALDVKYAISDNVLWSVFIHPLKELTEEQVLDAVSQVYYAKVNFGTTFSSTSLVFPGKKPNRKEKTTPKSKEFIDKM